MKLTKQRLKEIIKEEVSSLKTAQLELHNFEVLMLMDALGCFMGKHHHRSNAFVNAQLMRDRLLKLLDTLPEPRGGYNSLRGLYLGPLEENDNK